MFLEGGWDEGDWDELDFALEAVPIGGREEPVAGFTGGTRGADEEPARFNARVNVCFLCAGFVS